MLVRMEQQHAMERHGLEVADPAGLPEAGDTAEEEPADEEVHALPGGDTGGEGIGGSGGQGSDDGSNRQGRPRE